LIFTAYIGGFNSAVYHQLTSWSQCTTYSVSQINPPHGFLTFFSQTDGNFLINFCTPITRSFLH